MEVLNEILPLEVEEKEKEEEKEEKEEKEKEDQKRDSNEISSFVNQHSSTELESTVEESPPLKKDTRQDQEMETILQFTPEVESPEKINLREAKLEKWKKKVKKRVAEFGLLVITLFVPISLDMLLVIISIRTISFDVSSAGKFTLDFEPEQRKQSRYEIEVEEEEEESTAWYIYVFGALGFVILIVIVTFTLLTLFKYKFDMFLKCYMWFQVGYLLSLLSYDFFLMTFQAYNLPIDWCTLLFGLLQIGAGGVMCVAWKGPMYLQQAYLIFMSALVSLTLVKVLSTVMIWIFLTLMIFWDLIAVLCPGGPLKGIIDAAEGRKDAAMPALLYSSAMMWRIAQKAQDDSDDDNEGEMDTNINALPSANPNPSKVVISDSIRELTSGSNRALTSGPSKQHQGTEEHHSSVGKSLASRTTTSVKPDLESQPSVIKKKKVVSKPTAKSTVEDSTIKKPTKKRRRSSTISIGVVQLGLGDFIFYGVLVAVATEKGDWNTCIAALFAILMGLCITMILLDIYEKALPALPVSIAFGIVIYFISIYILEPFVDIYTGSQVFI